MKPNVTEPSGIYITNRYQVETDKIENITAEIGH